MGTKSSTLLYSEISIRENVKKEIATLLQHIVHREASGGYQAVLRRSGFFVVERNYLFVI